MEKYTHLGSFDIIVCKLLYAIYLDYYEAFYIFLQVNSMTDYHNIQTTTINKENPLNSPKKHEKNDLIEDVNSLVLGQREHNIESSINQGDKETASKELKKATELDPSVIKVIKKQAECPQDLSPSRSPKKGQDSKEESPSKRRKTAHNLNRKEDSSSSDDQEQREMKVAKKRKYTMENKNDLPKRLPEYSPEKKRVNVVEEQREKEKKDNFPKEDLSANILQPSEAMLSKQKEINKTILNPDKRAERTYFLCEAIPLGTSMTFQVMIDDDSMVGREYSFWLSGTEGKLALMLAKKHLRLFEDFFVFSQYIEDLNAMNFLAKMKSDLTRVQYNLTNQPEHQDYKGKLILADLSVYSTEKNNPSLGIYFPAFDIYTNQQKAVKMCEDSQILKTLSKGGESINCLSPCKLDPIFEKRFIQDNKLLATGKNLALIDRQGLLKLYVTKTESKKYRIYAGSGVSPLIIFAIFVVLFEST